MLPAVCLILIVPAFLVCLYYGVMAVFSFHRRSGKRHEHCAPVHTFTILVPAHDEEDSIGATLECCRVFDYPESKYSVVVVADNCSDGTAAKVHQAGSHCLERTSQDRRGKGHALSWALERVLPQGPDAVLILDADCLPEPGTLRAFDRYLIDGADVVQSNLVSSNPEESPISYALAIGNYSEKNMFYAGKSRLGLPVLLQGTGMLFRSNVFTSHPWRAHSIVEDAEYTVQLLRAGVRVVFAQDIVVATASPRNTGQMDVQRTRWASGSIGFGMGRAWQLIWQGYLRRQWRLIDCGWSLLVISRPLIFAELLAALLVTAACRWLAGGTALSLLLGVCLFFALFHCLYFALAIVRFGMNRRRFGLLVRTPAVVARLVLIFMRSLIRPERDSWSRTPRG